MGFPIGLKFVLRFENRINTQSNKELENSKGFSMIKSSNCHGWGPHRQVCRRKFQGKLHRNIDFES